MICGGSEDDKMIMNLQHLFDASLNSRRGNTSEITTTRRFGGIHIFTWRSMEPRHEMWGCKGWGTASPTGYEGFGWPAQPSQVIRRYPKLWNESIDLLKLAEQCFENHVSPRYG